MGQESGTVYGDSFEINKDRKKVSVIVPCYNATKWLPQCFLSLAKQTIGIEQIELIFVDDASTDDGATWEMLCEFERAFPESVMIIHLEENMRQGGARNVALEYASGEYLAFVDADDFVAEDYLEKVYKRAIETKADIVQFDFYYYSERVGVLPVEQKGVDEEIYITSDEQRKAFLLDEKITYGCWNKLYRREMVQAAGVKYMEHVVYEEPLFVYPLLFYGNRFVRMKEAFYYYRQNNSGTMRDDMKQMATLKMHTDVQLAVWNFMKRTEFFEDYREEIKLYFLHTYFYETLYFAKQRGFQISLDFFEDLRYMVEKEVPDYYESCYEARIPAQMRLYRMSAKGNVTERMLQEYLAGLQ